jgi:hypothetical protein
MASVVEVENKIEWPPAKGRPDREIACDATIATMRQRPIAASTRVNFFKGPHGEGRAGDRATRSDAEHFNGTQFAKAVASLQLDLFARPACAKACGKLTRAKAAMNRRVLTCGSKRPQS